MTAYSKRATPEQREWLVAYEAATSFEALHQDDFDAGTMTFKQVVNANVRWFENWYGNAMNAIPEFLEEA